MSPRLQRYQESDYMDPDQVLCLGALFDIAATNVNIIYLIYLKHWSLIICVFLSLIYWNDKCQYQGLDMGRKLCILGFCRSVEMLSDVVEDIVVEHGGEVDTCLFYSLLYFFLQHQTASPLSLPMLTLLSTCRLSLQKKRAKVACMKS